MKRSVRLSLLLLFDGLDLGLLLSFIATAVGHAPDGRPPGRALSCIVVGYLADQCPCGSAGHGTAGARTLGSLLCGRLLAFSLLLAFDANRRLSRRTPEDLIVQ